MRRLKTNPELGLFSKVAVSSAQLRFRNVLKPITSRLDAGQKGQEHVGFITDLTRS